MILCIIYSPPKHTFLIQVVYIIKEGNGVAVGLGSRDF